MNKRLTSKISTVRKAWWRGALYSAAAAALLAGCGGGGGGGGGGVTPPSNRSLTEEFSGASLDGNVWGTYSSSQTLQRTRFGLTPLMLREGNTSFARLQLKTFNATTFQGTEIFTRQRFARGNGLEMSTRMRAPGVPPGVVFAFFSIYDRYTGSPPNDANYLKTEIDFEFLGSQQEQFTPRNQRNRLYLNVWDDWNLSYGYDGDDVATPSRLHDDKTYQPSKTTGYDWANWNVYTIRWLPTRIDYLVNGVVERTETRIRPNEDMSVHFNIWAATADFNQAFSSNLSPAANLTYNVDVDYLTVREIGGAASVAGAATEPSPAYEPPAAGLPSYRNR